MSRSAWQRAREGHREMFQEHDEFRRLNSEQVRERMAQHPDPSRVLCYLIIALEREGQVEAALDELDGHVSRSGYRGKSALRLRVYLLKRQGRLEEAIESHLEIIQRGDRCANGYCELGDLYMKAGNREAARASWRHAASQAYRFHRRQRPRSLVFWTMWFIDRTFFDAAHYARFRLFWSYLAR